MSDLISRAKVMNVVQNADDGNIPYEIIKDIIQGLPSVSATPIQCLPSDLISRADAMGAVQDHFNANGFKGYDDGQKMMDRIKALPSVSAERVGEWIGEADGYADGELVYDMWYCSNCDYQIDDDREPTFNYCPNCGAKMKGGNE